MSTGGKAHGRGPIQWDVRGGMEELSQVCYKLEAGEGEREKRYGHSDQRPRQ